MISGPVQVVEKTRPWSTSAKNIVRRMLSHQVNQLGLDHAGMLAETKRRWAVHCSMPRDPVEWTAKAKTYFAAVKSAGVAAGRSRHGKTADQVSAAKLQPGAGAPVRVECPDGCEVGV